MDMNMDINMSNMTYELNRIEIDQYALNQLLINLIKQMFIKNNIDDPNDIIYTIADYIDIHYESPIITTIALQLNIINLDGKWVWHIN